MSNESWKPNLFIPGFAKSGSTALVDYLKQHPDIFVPQIKEPYTLSTLDDYPLWIEHHRGVRFKDLKLPFDEYLKLYSEATNYKYKVDGSQSYTWEKGFAKRLKDYSPNSKILLIIREPKKRAVSAYFFRYSVFKKDFKTWLVSNLLPFIDSFLTYSQVVEYYKIFGDNLRVIRNNELSREPNIVMSNIFRYLELKPINIKPVVSNTSIVVPTQNNAKKFILKLAFKSVDTLHKTLDPLGLKVVERIVNTLKNSKFVSTIINKDKDKVYKSYLEAFPKDIAELLEDDYTKTIEFISKNNIIIDANG